MVRREDDDHRLAVKSLVFVRGASSVVRCTFRGLIRLDPGIQGTENPGRSTGKNRSGCLTINNGPRYTNWRAKTATFIAPGKSKAWPVVALST